jgi:hypothetical protein
MMGVLGQIGPCGRVRQALDESGFETDRRPDGVEVVSGPTVQVDPQQLALADPFRQPRRELDLAILAVGIVEADPEPAIALARRGDQWMTASRIATRTATNAVAYWSTSIDRSTCWLTGGSITTPA